MQRFTFHVHNHEWTVRLQPGVIKDDKAEDDENIWGLTEYAQKRITVRTQDPQGVDVHPDHLRGVLMHEVMHVVMHEAGYNPGHHYGTYNDEDVVGVSAPVVLAIFADERNGELRARLGVPGNALPAEEPDDFDPF